MKRAAALWFVLVCGRVGCAESEPNRAPAARPSGGVFLSNRDPGSCCRALGVVEVESDRGDEPTTTPCATTRSRAAPTSSCSTASASSTSA